MDEMNHEVAGQYLTFKMGKEQYGVRVVNIKEVLEVPQITIVPRMPEYMAGVINLRGSVVPVIDLRLKFGLGRTESTVSTSIIVMEIDDIHDGDQGQMKLIVGVFSDSVQKVITLDGDQIEPAPRIGTSVDTSFLHGMGRQGDDFILLLNMDRILTTSELLKVSDSFESSVPQILKSESGVLSKEVNI